MPRIEKENHHLPKLHSSSKTVPICLSSTITLEPLTTTHPQHRFQPEIPSSKPNLHKTHNNIIHESNPTQNQRDSDTPTGKKKKNVFKNSLPKTQQTKIQPSKFSKNNSNPTNKKVQKEKWFPIQSSNPPTKSPRKISSPRYA